ncbi:transglycosylase SLT domain-containing protein, partial [candidate division KSB3 bacterium]|nr:transglycosylase SLT domain-containing protein [candidate division KSB3 bacterium]MBD3325467.1 transglycosylase SLT domain-containing protein [candidate division KSB3 bacterium]
PLDYLKFPLAYWDLIQTYAQKNELAPFLVAGIIRQESAYNPRALSYANARGLMQVIPPTARRVAAQLKLRNFQIAHLYDAETNIAIGTRYLADLLKKFDGNLYRAIAGYNAGPNATQKWWTAEGEIDHEAVVENITYRATRNYVKRVLRNQYNYQRIYGESLIRQVAGTPGN